MRSNMVAPYVKRRVFAVAVENAGRRNLMFARLLGLCPLLAVTTTALNGLLLGAATLAALAGSGIAVSILRPVIAHETRLLVYVIVIAVMVGAADLVMEAYVYESHLTLGLFVPLIVTNCAIFATIETSAARKSMGSGSWDCLTCGAGLVLALFAVGLVRELIATGALGSLSGETSDVYVQLAILPPGAFFALAALIAVHQWSERRKADDAA